MTSPSGRAGARRSRPGSAQWLLGLLLVLAIGASVAMIFTPDRSIVASLAVIAALWAAVIGAILVTKFRRQADTAESKTRDLRIVYELQLEREINARKQYELGVEAQVRREVRAESSAELRELQEQVASLRSSLELLIGDLPEDRVALEAERLRELEAAGATPTPGGGATERDIARTASPATDGRATADDAPTDQWARITDEYRDGSHAGQTYPPGSFATPEPGGSPSRHSPPTHTPPPASPTRPRPPQAPAPEPQTSAQPPARAGSPTHTGPDRPVGGEDVGRHGRRGDDASPSVAPGPTEPTPTEANDGARAVEDTIADATAAWATSTSTPSRDRHRAAETTPGAHSNGRSVSELMEQFTSRASGGRRRRRED